MFARLQKLRPSSKAKKAQVKEDKESGSEEEEEESEEDVEMKEKKSKSTTEEDEDALSAYRTYMERDFIPCIVDMASDMGNFVCTSIVFFFACLVVFALLLSCFVSDCLVAVVSPHVVLLTMNDVHV